MQRKIWITFLVGVFALPAVAAAHNLGHVFLPDGACMEIGSGQEAPLVGQDRTQLDLVPSTPNPPRDEFGASYVGYWGRTPIRPGRCPVTPGATGQSNTTSTSSATTVGAKTQTAGGSTPRGAGGPWIGGGLSKKEK